MRIECKRTDRDHQATLDIEFDREVAEGLAHEWAEIHVPESYREELRAQGLVGVGIISQIQFEVEQDSEGWYFHPHGTVKFRVID